MSVEGRHAVFEWNSKALCFNIRDLGGVNGVSLIASNQLILPSLYITLILPIIDLCQ